MNPEWIGSAAGILTTAAYVPQTIKVLRERHTTSISFYTYLLLSAGVGFWAAYGIMIESPSVLWANFISLCMILTILLMKIRHG